MSPADLARLELARRAYQATQPTELEVQTGVRRARLSLLRPKQRRRWFLKGLVFVVLALGGLAYAKPHALGELATRGFTHDRPEKRVVSGGASGDTVVVSAPGEPGTAARRVPVAQSAPVAHTPPSSGEASTVVSAPEPPAPPPDSPSHRGGVRRGKPRASLPSPAPSAAEASASSAARGEDAVSDWGRVGQALAQGDEAAALAALGKLSQSDDESTRDKADLGRAQLMMANGEKARACELARALVHRRALGHVHRQALLLLDGCSR
jgi:hypothetical protein